MGDGNYGDPPQNRSRDWGLSYNQWQFILGMVDGFRDLITNQFVVVMKQYSSPNYTKECCPTCSTNMTRVLRGEWSDNDWQTASKAVYTQLQNCDTWTYSAVIDTVRVWNQKKNWSVCRRIFRESLHFIGAIGQLSLAYCNYSPFPTKNTQIQNSRRISAVGSGLKLLGPGNIEFVSFRLKWTTVD